MTGAPTCGVEISVDEYFAGKATARRLYVAVRRAVMALGAVAERATRSQIAFRREHAFAWVWRPDRHLRGTAIAPLVLTIDLFRRDRSPRWKEVVEPRPGRFTHHLELRSAREVDAEVKAWLEEAWETAGLGRR